MEDSRSREFQAILFDLDGTLLDTSWDFVVVVNNMLAEDGRPPLAADSIRAEVSNGSSGLTTLAYGLKPDDIHFEQQRQRFLTAYQHHISAADRSHQPVLFEGMDDLLMAIEARDIPWGIVTNKPRPMTEILLAQLNLSDRCSVLVCPEDVRKPKPDPQALWLAADTIDIPPEACIYVGDHERDIQAGQAASMTTVAALYGFIPDSENPDTWGADHQIQAPLDLLEWLDDCDWSLPEF